MIRKALSGTMLALMLICATLTFNIHPAKASGTIYIRADGSVDPPTAPISSTDNITYTFTDSIYDSIIVERGNIIIDGDGNALQGSGTGDGFSWNNINNVTVKRTNIKGFSYNVRFSSSSGSRIVQNNITSIRDGIYMQSSSNNTLSNNNINGNNDPAVYGYGIALVLSINNKISGNNVADNKEGIRLEASSDNILSDNNVIDNGNGIFIYRSSSNIISGNNVTGAAWDGIGFISFSSYNTIIGNGIRNNYHGIVLYINANNNTITGNNIAANTWDGMEIFSSGNTVTENNIAENKRGALLAYSSDNSFYHNNFMDNDHHVFTDWSMNIWDNGYPSGGNYWSDYTARYPSAKETDNSGVWDTPYIIDGNNRDNYPLMEPWTPTPPAIMANIDITPDTLNLRSNGQWITAYIQLPEGYNAEDIDASTITLGGTIQPVLDPSNDFVTNSSEYLVDHNGDGILERMVKFDRASIASWMYQSVGMQHEVSLTITGELTDGTPFEGTDTISVVYTGGGSGRRK